VGTRRRRGFAFFGPGVFSSEDSEQLDGCSKPCRCPLERKWYRGRRLLERVLYKSEWSVDTYYIGILMVGIINFLRYI
jgi:hypothetical protein